MSRVFKSCRPSNLLIWSMLNCLRRKKEAYADYRQIREEMRELLVVKANVDRILGIEKNDATQKEEPNKNRS